jgi:hypothetical protein
LAPAFQFRHIKELYPIIWAKSEEMVQEMLKAINKPGEVTEENPDGKPSNVIEVSSFSNRAALDSKSKQSSNSFHRLTLLQSLA